LPEQLQNITLDDHVLVRQCKQGDSEAMGRLILKYQDRIYNTILKICANKDDAAELTQETFVKVIERINSFKGQSAFYTWLFRVAVNLTYNYCKRRVKLPTYSLENITGPEFGDSGAQLKTFLADESTIDPALIAQNREIGQIALAALSRLDEDHRVVIVLRDIEGMAYDEIAQTLQVELGTVKSRLSRARANLKSILETVLK
jgi:RNA polymerase sigma-70 factor (ECF subfamily)